MAKWLVKSEPGNYSIDDMKRDRVTYWDGVRNYQARNFLKEMKKGDELLFYHSVVDPIGIHGLCKVKNTAAPDPTQFEKKSQYYDPKATKENPRWFCPDVQFVKKFKNPLTLSELREVKGLEKMELLRKGSRLSVQPVSEKEYKIILKLAE